jgi:AmmeMemoRadiSam system protein B
MVSLNRTILIISSDFTHNADSQTALQNDRKSISLLPDKKISDIVGITNDCRQCTAFLFGYLKNTATAFKLVENTNSFAVSGENPDSVTSYLSAYFIAVTATNDGQLEYLR